MVSFQGARRTIKKEEQLIRVADYMTKKLYTFKPEQSLDEVVTVLLKRNISGGPVVDDNNSLVGIISEGDCLKEVVKGKYNNVPSLNTLVKEVMIRDVKTVDPDMNIFEVASMFLSLKLRRFPVMKEGKLLGQISQKNIMRAVQKLKNETW